MRMKPLNIEGENNKSIGLEGFFVRENKIFKLNNIKFTLQD